MAVTSSTLSIRERPKKELVLTQVIENVGDGSTHPLNFGFGQHMGFWFDAPVMYVDQVARNEGTIKFTIRVWVPDCLKTFDDPNYSDASITVDGKEFFVSKLFLCSQATYFDSAFKWAAQQGKEPKLTVDTFYAYEVQRFLEVIHGENITEDDDMETLFEMCRFFDSQTGIRRCAQFVFYSSKMCQESKFRLAEKFDVSELKVLLIESVDNVQELRRLLSVNRSSLNQNELLAFVDKSLELHDK